MTTQEKSIVIAVTGSIAAFKTCELVRSLAKQGYPVQVIMTPNAERFIGRVTFQALTDRPVYVSEWETGMVHIDVKNMAGVFAVVPITANTIGKFANGIADDIVSSTYLALGCPVLIAPAMNPGMFAHPAVQRNLSVLRQDGVQILDPTSGEVVCGDSGQGKMADIATIENRIIEVYRSATS
ncbi:MAG: phosphopantothenoylcysteine decarboxylase [Leptospiraceae bacterium]|nr:phosphopantothenoylcysteine decarboxylase [Leptospiraceae bacterium]MCB1318223.1 phosphopantothenoylcysteine decarboxylase [Leptospiraceae bacterium]MCB1322972.1 phosphopantothenoylcysteine decarboxylase [Leptospiraceae bacterium]